MNPGVNLLFGASTYDYIYTQEAPSYTARNIREGLWLESHNSALITDGTKRTEIFHKSKLVVGVEHTPYPRIFCPLDNKLGGVMGRCVGQDEISLLNVKGDGSVIPVGCAVCYESVYGEYYTDYIRKGARAMTIITNDAWWGNTPGHKRLFDYCRLRAIETRRAIARSANTGISGFISPRGGVIGERLEWDERGVLTADVELRNDVTFYMMYGDWVARIATYIAAMSLLYYVAKKANNGASFVDNIASERTVNYIDKYLNMIDELYELTVKIFETDVVDLMNEWRFTIGSDGEED